MLDAKLANYLPTTWPLVPDPDPQDALFPGHPGPLLFHNSLYYIRPFYTYVNFLAFSCLFSFAGVLSHKRRFSHEKKGIKHLPDR